MIMSRVCSICGKGPVAGNSRSHALNISKRVFRPNLRRTKLEIDGKVETAYVCTKCLKGSKKDKYDEKKRDRNYLSFFDFKKIFNFILMFHV